MLIPRGVLKIRNIAAQEKTRYAMNGVCFSRTPEGKAKACATDGKMLAMVTWEDEKAESIDSADRFGVSLASSDKLFTVIPCEALARADKAMGKKNGKPVTKLLAVEESGDPSAPVKLATLDDSMSATVASVPALEGHFPPVDDVLPKEGSGLRITFNAEFLHRLACSLAEASNAFGRELGPTVTLEMTGPDSAINVRVSCVRSGPDVRGVLMPIMSGEDDDEKKANAAAWERATAAVAERKAKPEKSLPPGSERLPDGTVMTPVVFVSPELPRRKRARKAIRPELAAAIGAPESVNINADPGCCVTGSCAPLAALRVTSSHESDRSSCSSPAPACPGELAPAVAALGPCDLEW